MVGVIPRGIEPSLVTPAFGSLWVTGEYAPMLVRVDPVRARVVARIPIGSGGGGMVRAGDNLWVVGSGSLLEIRSGAQQRRDSYRHQW